MMFKTIALTAVLAGAVLAPAAAAERHAPRPDPQAMGDWGNGGRGNFGPQRDEARGWGRYDVMPSWRIARALREQGFFGADIMDRRSDVVIARAASRGRDFVVTVDARTGNVLRARPVGQPRGGYDRGGRDGNWGWQRW